MAEVDDLESRCDRLEHDLCTAQHACEDLEHCVEQRHDELTTAIAAIEDLNVQCKFWRQAAEHAVKGWNDLEDRVEAAREALVAIEHNADTALELLGMRDDCAPVAPSIDFAAITKDPTSTGFPRLVEIETPRDGRKEKP